VPRSRSEDEAPSEAELPRSFSFSSSFSCSIPEGFDRVVCSIHRDQIENENENEDDNNPRRMVRPLQLQGRSGWELNPG
jgi:hypothetical protein